MLIGLTGSPRVGGIEYADQAIVTGEAADESVLSTRRGGRVVVLEERFRPSGEVVWSALTEGEALALQADIGYVCDLDVRTHRDGDPDWAQELTIRVKRESTVQLVSPNNRIDVRTGRPAWAVRFQWSSVATYTLAELGLGPIGGWELAAQDAESVTYTAYGSASETEEPFDVTFDGVVYGLIGYRLGDARTVAARVTETSDGLGATIHSRTPGFVPAT